MANSPTIDASRPLNRKRVALSLFVLGAVIGPTAFHQWSDWKAAATSYRDWRRIEAQQRNIRRFGMTYEHFIEKQINLSKACETATAERAEENYNRKNPRRPAFVGPPFNNWKPSPPLPQLNGPIQECEAYRSLSELLNVPVNEDFESYRTGVLAGLRELVPWFLAIGLGGVLLMLIGLSSRMFVLTAKLVFLKWLPGAALGYIRWLRGPLD
jgi:hypothetical protein